METKNKMGEYFEDLSKIFVASAVAESIAKKHRKILTCENCGKKVPAEKGVSCRGTSWGCDCDKDLCIECANRCRKCKKYYCSKHIDKHKCK